VKWLARLRVVIALVIVVLFSISLLAILLTGPVLVRVRDVEIDADVSPDRLRQTVETLCDDFGPRDYKHRENLDRVATWIASRFSEAGLATEIQEYETESGVFSNVIARQVGRDPRAPAIVFGAHYDTYAGLPGADDNASGVAVLLELARTLPDRQPRRDHFFVAFSTEEPPFFRTDDMGSYRFARLLQERNVEVELMVALDLVGYYSDEPGSQRFPVPGLGLFYPDAGNFAAVVGDTGAGRWILQVKQGMRSTSALPVHSFRAPAFVPGVDWSDHLSFRRLGLPGVLVTDTAHMRYDHYHTPTDTPEKLDYERMARLVVALHGVLFGSYR
jgi:Zn-dependent M28 family amino/carboxypeptidase